MREITSVKQLFYSIYRLQPSIFLFAALATLVGNFLVIAISLYSMQLYDRVIPTGNQATLVVLSIGVIIALVLETAIKFARGKLIQHANKKIDLVISSVIFDRVLNIRLDKFPVSIGALSSQLRSYETVRRFMSAFILFAMVDLPFVLVFVFAIALIANSYLASIPLFFALTALSIGFYYKWRITSASKNAHKASTYKMGKLVEHISNIETIKSAGLKTQALNEWRRLNVDSIEHESDMVNINEHAQYYAAMIQQLSYITLVSMGAFILISQTQLTMGSIIAISILSGRILAPISTLPGLIVQAANAEVSLTSLNAIFALDQETNDDSQQLRPATLSGQYAFYQACFDYKDKERALFVDDLVINAGEKLAIIGGIGSGKSTLLKVMAGLYPLTNGKGTLDGLDLSLLSRDVFNTHVGYLPQTIQLFSGTLRSNLTLGRPVDEEHLIEVCKALGLDQVINHHPRGIEMVISENGLGLSGGQKQLVGLARLMLSKPNIWLLDEPTASLDAQTEKQVISVLQQAIKPEDTLVIITHNITAIQPLIKRIVLLSPDGIKMDKTKTLDTPAST